MNDLYDSDSDRDENEIHGWQRGDMSKFARPEAQQRLNAARPGEDRRNHLQSSLAPNGTAPLVEQRDFHNVSYSQIWISLQILQEWSTLENDYLLVSSVYGHIQSLEMLLHMPEIPVEWTYNLVIIFNKIVHTHSHQSITSVIIAIIMNSKFLESQMKFFLDNLPQNMRIYRQLFSIMRDVFDLVEAIMKRFPDYHSKCFSALSLIKEAGNNIPMLKCGNNLTSRLSHLLEKVQQDVPMLRRKQRVKDIPKSDGESPPEDFTEMEILPDLQELEASYEPFLRANKTDGPYRDVKHYTDIHFRLLREDYLSPIRNGIRDFQIAREENQEVKSTELRFYYGVQLAEMKINHNDGISFRVKFETEDLKDVNWEFSRRFMHGALLCFTKDNFENVIFATVADRNPEDLAVGIVKVTFESQLEDLLTSSVKDTFIMAETVSFFESYRHVLEGLQEVEEIPLSDYILYCQRHIMKPAYIDHNTCFDFSSIMKREVKRQVTLLSSADWPDADETLLNNAQLNALKLALTKELAIIQGPPGTGKTYIGLKIMDLLLKNKTEMNSSVGPILVVCYTNHALDQFLEGILEFCDKGIVRVGGRSRSERLEQFNLKALTKNERISKNIKRSIENELYWCRKQFRQICWNIKSLWHESVRLETTILTVDDLENEMSEDHKSSLTHKSRCDGAPEKVMGQWMKAANANMERCVFEAAKNHLTSLIIKPLDEEAIGDAYLLSKAGLVRPEFETRVSIYRGWLLKLLNDLNERERRVVMMTQEAGEEILEDIARQREDMHKDILSDDIITKYMTNPNIFERIKQCVALECGENDQDSYVKSWLLGYFRNADHILDAISQFSRLRRNAPSRVIKNRKIESENEMEEPEAAWVIAESDEDDDFGDRDYMGFDFHDDDDDDSFSFNENSETSEMISKFKNLETNFSMSEKKEVSLLRKVKLLGIKLKEDTEQDTAQYTQSMGYFKVFELIYASEPFTDEEASAIKDLWSLSLPERYRLYKYWMLKKKEIIAQKIIDFTSMYKHTLEKKKDAQAKKIIAILKRAQVIGMTTTGAAMHRKIMGKVAPRIIVVEEAAEVLEAHIITTLNKCCKHLILIGDHQQLQPSPTVYRLAKDYKLEISLFERLVKNNLRKVVLDQQHRMRPQIASYMRLIYPNLNDHYTVKSYENVKGVASNVYFIQHEFHEKNVEDSNSKENIHEAEFLQAFCKYFLQQGYSGYQITILAAYRGQVAILREYFEMNDLDENVKITSIDNYQGEENDIVLLSLVRCNAMDEVGFLKTSNRVCVALSRARKGLFVIGNLKALAKKSELWKKIIQRAYESHVIGSSIELKCVNHPTHISCISSPDEFYFKVPEGGCNVQCKVRLRCGHTCLRRCHPDDTSHVAFRCEQPCLKHCREGHPCQSKCYEECGPCKTLVEKRITICGHTDIVQCHEDESTAFCHQKCGRKLECGHICQAACGECRREDSHSPCKVKVERHLPCSHSNLIPCHANVKLFPCPTECKHTLACEHKCNGTCGECLNGRVHKVCDHRCKKILPCGHRCGGKCGMQCEPCQERCPMRCRHGACSKLTCGEPCDSCMENCAMVCKHQQCHERCADRCTKSPSTLCKRKCQRTTKCGHACSSLCGEECVCLNCEYENFRLLDFSKWVTGKTVPVASKERAAKYKPGKDTLMKIPGCGHIFTMNQLDEYIARFDPNGTMYTRCPCCKNPTDGIRRYDEQNKARFLRRENRKKDVIQSFQASDPESVNQAESVEKSEDEKQPLNANIQKSFKYHNIFGSVLKKIERIHEHFNWTHEFNKDKWQNTVNNVRPRVTDQFIEELTMEFHRLLILEQISALKQLLSNARLKLDEPLKSQTNLKRKFLVKLDAASKDNAEKVINDVKKYLSEAKADDEIEREITMLSQMVMDVQRILPQIDGGGS